VWNRNRQTHWHRNQPRTLHRFPTCGLYTGM